MISVFNRLGTGQLCQGYIRLLTSLLDQLDLTVFSLPSLLLSLLLRRLLLLAGPQAAPSRPLAGCAPGRTSPRTWPPSTPPGWSSTP